MSQKALLGVEWLDFYKRWVINIVNNINPNFDGFYFGFTSRDLINEIGEGISNKKIYIFPIYQNLHLKLFSLFGGENAVIFYGQLIDKFAVTLSGLLTGEILYALFITKAEESDTSISVSDVSKSSLIDPNKMLLLISATPLNMPVITLQVISVSDASKSSFNIPQGCPFGTVSGSTHLELRTKAEPLYKYFPFS